MSDNQTMTLSAVLELKDRLTGKIKSVNKSLDGVKTSTEKVDLSLNAIKKSMESTGKSAASMSQDVNKAKQALNGVKGTYNATIGMKDNTTTRLKGVEASLKSLSGKAYTAAVNVRVNGAQKLAGLKTSLSNMASGMMMGLPMQVAGMAGLGYGVMDTINTYKNFEKQMAAVRSIATSGMGTAEADAAMTRLTAKAREMGAVTQFSAEQVGKAFEYMALAGWKEKQMMSGIKPVLDLALAAGEDLGTVSDIVTDSMTALKIDTRGANADDNIKRFTDVLAATAANSNTTVGMMGEAFKYAASAAGLFTQSYGDQVGVAKDVALMLGLMADSGIKASMAGTALRSTLTRMTADTIPTANAMAMLGVNIMQVGKDGTQQLKPLRSIIDDLRKKFKEGVSAESLVNYAEALSGTKTRNKEKMIEFANQLAKQNGKMNAKDQAKFAKMFAGEEAISGWLAMITASDADYQAKINAIDNSEGAADKMAADRANTLAGDLEILKSAWHDFQIELMSGKGASGLREFIQGLSKDVTQFKTALKDGLDIGDIGNLALTVLKQLKDKFIELDGIGSLLAGGALAFGLTKIYGLTKKIVGGLKTFATGKTAGGALPTAAGAETVGTMTVNATTVIVNGKNVKGGKGGKGGKGSNGGNTTVVGGDAPNTTNTKTGRWAKYGGAAKAGGLALAFSALDVMATRSMTAERELEASERLQAATADFKALKADDDIDTRNQVMREMLDAQRYAKDTERLNRAAEFETYGGAAGAMVGAAIGSFVGPWGTVAGGIIGDIVGRKIGEYISSTRNPMDGFNENSTFVRDVIRQMNGLEAPKPVYFDQSGKSVNYTFGLSNADNLEQQAHADTFGINTDLSQSKLHTGYDIIAQETEAARTAVEEANSAIDMSCELTGNNIRLNASNTAQSVSNDFQLSAFDTQNIWTDTAGILQSEAYSPLQEGAAETSASMTADFSASATDTQSAWAGVRGFFESLWADLKAGAASCAASMAQTMANAAANLRANGHTTLAGAVDWAGNNLAWLGGVSYKPKGDAIGTSWAEGGLTEINEHGGEIVDLPTGSRVYPHATTQKLIKEELAGGNDAGGDKVANISITGNTFTVREEADIDKIAYKLYQLIEGAQVNYNPI